MVNEWQFIIHDAISVHEEEEKLLPKGQKPTCIDKKEISCR